MAQIASTLKSHYLLIILNGLASINIQYILLFKMAENRLLLENVENLVAGGRE